MPALRLAYSARPAPTFLPVGRWLRQAWFALWDAVKAHLGDRYGVPRPPRLH